MSKIGLLDAFDFGEKSKPLQGDYGLIAAKAIVDTFSESSINSDSCVVKTYKVAQGQLPISASECDLWIVSGSPASAYEPQAWIMALSSFIRAADKDRHKILGFCFGHQMIAHSLGGCVEKSEKGWGLGVRAFDIKKKHEWMTPYKENIRLLMTHQDQVLKPPEGSQIIAASQFCPVEMYIKGNHILSIQGHPEFTTSFARKQLESRAETLNKTAYRSATTSLDHDVDSHLILGWVSRWLES